MKAASRQGQTGGGANTAQLKDAIDRGLTNDKVDWPDPAAAPLGTDDEAAGHPPSARLVQETLNAETSRPAGEPPRPSIRIPLLPIGLALLVAAVVLIWVLGWG